MDSNTIAMTQNNYDVKQLNLNELLGLLHKKISIYIEYFFLVSQ